MDERRAGGLDGVSDADVRKLYTDEDLNITPEVCCELCGETIHNHFDCPACEKKFAPTDTYAPLDGWDKPIEFRCESCGASFRMVSGSDPIIDSVWERLPPNHHRDQGASDGE